MGEKIERVIASAHVKAGIPLDSLSDLLDGHEYESDSRSIIFNMKTQHTSVLVFRTGKIIAIGRKPQKSIRTIIKKIKEFIDIDEENINIKVNNVIVSRTMKNELNLDKLSFYLEDSEYQPNRFPGLVYKTLHPSSTLILFSSGRIICTHTTSVKQAAKAMDELENTIQSI